jgi:hypothetical protein
LRDPKHLLFGAADFTGKPDLIRKPTLTRRVTEQQKSLFSSILKLRSQNPFVKYSKAGIPAAA